MATFTERMWAEIGPWYGAILDLPFNAELAAGTLGRDRFVHYMIQDAHYLGIFARALAATAVKAPDAQAQIRFAAASQEALVVERALHEGFFADFGVSAARFAAEAPSPTCAAYGNFLLATALTAPFAVGVSALVPCFQIYYEVGKHLFEIAGDDNPYQKWIDTYRDEGFGDAVRAMLAEADAAHARAGVAEREEMAAVYRKAVRYEWMFWDAAWRREAWPLD